MYSQLCLNLINNIDLVALQSGHLSRITSLRAHEMKSWLRHSIIAWFEHKCSICLTFFQWVVSHQVHLVDLFCCPVLEPDMRQGKKELINVQHSIVLPWSDSGSSELLIFPSSPLPGGAESQQREAWTSLQCHIGHRKHSLITRLQKSTLTDGGSGDRPISIASWWRTKCDQVFVEISYGNSL